MAAAMRLQKKLALLVLLALQLRCMPRLPTTRSLVVPSAHFKDILDASTTRTAALFRGRPLGTMSPSARRLLIEGIVQQGYASWFGRPAVDPVPATVLKGPDSCWLVGTKRVMCKSCQLSWEACRWAFKINMRLGEETDQVLLAFYTPHLIYLYEYDLKLAVSSGVCGPVFAVMGPRGEEDWSTALASMLEKLASKPFCKRIAAIPLGSRLVQGQVAKYSNPAEDVYRGVPLAELSPNPRGRCIEELLRRLDCLLHPGAATKNAVLSNGTGGSGSNATWHYTPDGIHVYRHHGTVGFTSTGKLTVSTGHQIKLCGPSRQPDWSLAFCTISEKLRQSGCQYLATISWPVNSSHNTSWLQ